MVIDNKLQTSSIRQSLNSIGTYSIIQEPPITINRSIQPRFEIEKYTEKLIIRDINKDEKLLEFYIQEYPDIYDKKTSMLVSSIKKSIKNLKSSDLLDINLVGFITDKSLGVKDNLEFQYKIIEIDKIVKHNGYYIIKFFAEPIVNGDNILDKYRNEKLDKKYLDKEAKKIN